MGPYALFQADRHGNGIRPRPYSADHDDPAGHVRLDQDERVAYRLARRPARDRTRLGRDPLGLHLGSRSTSTASRRTSTRRGTRAGTPARCSTWSTVSSSRAATRPSSARVTRSSRPRTCSEAAPPAEPGRRMHALGLVLPPRRRLQRHRRWHESRRRHRGVRHASGLPPRVPESDQAAVRAVERRGRRELGSAELQQRRRHRPRHPDADELAVLAQGRLRDAAGSQHRHPDHPARVPGGHFAFGPARVSRRVRTGRTRTPGRPRRRGSAPAARSW